MFVCVCVHAHVCVSVCLCIWNQDLSSPLVDSLMAWMEKPKQAEDSYGLEK